jgi:tripartite-type tricarboxylate transporter receptor subunit TctC
MQRLRRGLVGLAAALLGLPLLSQAQQFPAGPVVIVVPFAPGGPTDLIPRAISPVMSQALGVPVIVENKPGAGGNLGAAYVARSKPAEQKILLFQNGLFTVNPWIFKDLPFNPEKDFVPVIDLASTPNVMVVNTQVGATSIRELIDLVKARPNSFNFGTPGAGTSPHLCVELFKLLADGLQIVHIPFKSGPDAVTNLVSNQVQLSCMNISAVLPSVRGKRLLPLAITSRARNGILPDVPTMEEAGFSEFEVLGWFGLAVPAATPRPIVLKLNSVVSEALRDPKVVERLNNAGLAIMGESADNVARNVAAESAKWQKLLEKMKIRVEN